MIILGISDSHEAHACIVKDGELLAAMGEERLSRLKADMGYPRLAIEAVLDICGLTSHDIDLVAFAGQSGIPTQILYKMNALFSPRDWARQSREYWEPKLLQNKELNELDDFNLFKHLPGEKLEQDPYYPFIEAATKSPRSEWEAIYKNLRKKAVVDHLGIPEDSIKFYRHEECHKIYGVYSDPLHKETSLVLTAEGSGDDSSATYSTWRNGTITEHWRSNAVNLGRLYRYVTLILGMSPGQHEYKVMGLAPYGTEYHGKRTLEFLNTLSTVQGSKILDNGIVKDLYHSLKIALEAERFDGIAWGLQSHLEAILEAWVENCIQETGISDVIFSGGISQNIKAVKHIIDNTSASSVWTGPISGDGSIGIGAAWLAHREHCPDIKLHGLQDVYLGTEYANAEIHQAVRTNNLDATFNLIEKPSVNEMAKWLEGGAICARYSGRMEFGQRALGARSIIADPRNWDSVERINNKIKYRDFWMPFTPSMTFEQAQTAIKNPKNVYSPFMTMAFDLQPDWVGTIPAATHPADKTVRPQMLKRENNPGYYDLIKAFGALTGKECLLNTSFNLHGDSIVESPDDAIQTFLKSDLDVLLFDDVAVSRSSLTD